MGGGWGWFGEPWWSYVCYDEAGVLLESSRVPFPAGESCMWCSEPFAPGDSGQRILAVRLIGAVIEHIHKECMLRMSLGSVAHLEGRCSCHGCGDWEEPGMTAHQGALAAWEWVRVHGTP
jgi:hypothetical protein